MCIYPNIYFVHGDSLEDSQLIAFNIETEIIHCRPINSQKNRIKGKTLDCCNSATAGARKFRRQNAGIDMTFSFLVRVFKKFTYSVMRNKRTLRIIFIDYLTKIQTEWQKVNKTWLTIPESDMVWYWDTQAQPRLCGF